MAKDPRDWGPDEVEVFALSADEDEVAELLKQFIDQPDEAGIGVLRTFLGARHGNTFAKPLPSQLAARALVLIGPEGVDVLKDSLLDDAQKVRYGPGVLNLLWQVSKFGRIGPSTNRVGNTFCSVELPAGTQRAAEQAVADIFARALEDPITFALVGNYAFQAGQSANLFEEGTSPNAQELMGMFGEASIKLSRAVLDQFKEILAERRREEDYQKFLTQNPVLLDPLAAEVVPKQKLGLEHATDYAVRRHDDRWLLVEIEKPRDRLFTKAGDFRRPFVHAFGQVLDFQSWVDNNVAYAQKHMRSIAAPRGLVVMGLRERLSSQEQEKLRRFVDNSQRIEVQTFDDLLDRGEALYESLHRL